MRYKLATYRTLAAIQPLQGSGTTPLISEFGNTGVWPDWVAGERGIELCEPSLWPGTAR